MVNIASSMSNLGFGVTYKNRHELTRHKSGALMVAVKRNIKLKWQTVKKKLRFCFLY